MAMIRQKKADLLEALETVRRERNAAWTSLALFVREIRTIVEGCLLCKGSGHIGHGFDLAACPDCRRLRDALDRRI